MDHFPKTPLFQPEKCSTPEFADQLRQLNADLFIVVAYGEIIKQDILDIPRLGCINVHASLLPKLRGAAPIQRAIINGDKETGITIMHMVKKMDAGDMIDRTIIPIGPEMTFGELEKAMMEASAPLLLKVVKELEAGTAPREVQDESAVTFAAKIELEDCEINWNKPAQEIHDLIRGVNPYPGAWAFLDLKGTKKRVKFFRSRIAGFTNEGKTPGTIMADKTNFKVACADGFVDILELQVEGKKSMQISEFLRGYNS
jgi:methionyl-tRNA formyltransferase